MDDLCYDIDYVTTEGDSPAALGNRIAATVIERGRDDGSLEETRYVDTDYKPVNAPLVVAESGTKMRDPDRWQPLALAQIVAQNGLPIPGKVQSFIGPHWGHVTSFALPESAEGLPIDPGPAPHLGDRVDEPYKQTALDVIRRSSQLDPADGAMVDIGPGALGANSLGTNDGNGHDENPATGKPYPPNRVLRGDYARALAEFWADGPKSETPPGHWNTVANEVSDSPGFVRRIGGRGQELSRLEWDVKLYLALNGAVHDAAIAAWGVKGFYDSARPISMIRYMGGRGPVERSERAGIRPERPAARSRPRRGDHRRVERSRESGTRTSRTIAARSPSRPGAATRRIPRRRRAEWAGSSRSTGCRISCRRSSRRRSPGTSPATARSAARRPRC